MISVQDAINTITKEAPDFLEETVSLSDLNGRILACDIAAKITQPPFAASAMDGYAVRAADLKAAITLQIIAETPAGSPFNGQIRKGQAVRLYTGSSIPDGADYVLVQERAHRHENQLRPSDDGPWPLEKNNIRPAGCDFHKNRILLTAKTRLAPVHLSLLAAANIDRATVVKKPLLTVFSNGSELVEPGSDVGSGQIVDSNHYALCALTAQWGATSQYQGRACDTIASATAMFKKTAMNANIILPVGGASVGDHDVVKPAFKAAGGSIVFENVAIKPGKPVWYGRLGSTQVIGLPGNPASAIVTAAVLVQPLVRYMAGRSPYHLHNATVTCAIPANGKRETWLRGSLCSSSPMRVTPAASQDSSLMMPFANSAALIRRPVDAPAANSGDTVRIALLDEHIP